MNTKEIAKMVSEETGEPAYKVQVIMASMFRVTRKMIIKAQVIKIKNLITIYIDIAQERTVFDVSKKEYKKLPRRFVLKVIPSAILKKEIDAKKTY